MLDRERHDLADEPEIKADPTLLQFIKIGQNARSYPLPHPVWAEIAANVWQVVAEEGQMVAEGDEICILESMKMEIPVITEVPGVVRELHVEPEQTVQEGDLIALIDES